MFIQQPFNPVSFQLLEAADLLMHPFKSRDEGVHASTAVSRTILLAACLLQGLDLGHQNVKFFIDFIRQFVVRFDELPYLSTESFVEFICVPFGFLGCLVLILDLSTVV